MPTNANTFNSRVTSEALEAKFRQVFPAQGGAELVQDLFASGVIQPVVDFSTVAEGSVLPQNLQTAWDFATGQTETGGTVQIITNTGFWKVDVNVTHLAEAGQNAQSYLSISDGLSTKKVWATTERGTAGEGYAVAAFSGVIFLRSGDSASVTAGSGQYLNVSYRQIADVNGTLVNPLGFTFS